MADIFGIRKEYTLHSLDLEHTHPLPLVQFDCWFQEALKAEVLEPNAFTLSTIDAKNRPNARTLLLKDYSEEGFTFFTNYNSTKAQEMAIHPEVCLLFFWPELERQVRIHGMVSKTTHAYSEKYFQSRPRGSQLGAYVSDQSSRIESKEVLIQKLDEIEKFFTGQEVLPLPPHWGGYQVAPYYYEFWQGRPNRLHDRVAYAQTANDRWEKYLLAP